MSNLSLSRAEVAIIYDALLLGFEFPLSPGEANVFCKIENFLEETEDE